MKTKILCLFLVSMVFAAGNVFAQTVQELRPGSFISGNLGYGQEIWYSVRTTQAGILTIETASDIDTYLEAYDAQRNFIKDDDDSGEGNNAKIEIIVAANTTYLFKLRGFSSNHTGPFRIFAAIVPMSAITELRVGSFRNGFIEAEESYWFSVRATENGLLLVETTGDTDTYLELYNENFVLLSYDDDGGEDLNARIEVAARAGTTFYYRLRAFGSGSGPYRIMASSRPYPAPTPLTLRNIHSGTILPGADSWYSVRTTQRGYLIVSVVSATGYTYCVLDIYNESHELINTADRGHDALKIIPVEANRTYIIRLRGYSSSDSGPYYIFAIQEQHPPAMGNIPGNNTITQGIMQRSFPSRF